MNRLLRSAKARLALLGALAWAIPVTGAAFASWSSSGAGSASAGVATLGAPSFTALTPGAASVALSWTTVSPPDTGTVTYSVSRDGSDAGGTCPTVASPAAVTSCTDTGVSTGSHSYTVTARWRTWTATSTTSSATVASGAATHLVLAAATTTPSSGAADSLTITAKDAAGLTVTSYTGDKSLTFSGASTIGTSQPTVSDKTGAAVAFGTATTITFTNGVAAVSGAANGVARLYKAEAALVVVSDGTIGNGTGLAVTVSAGTATQIVLTGATTNLTSGSSRTVTATIEDAAGNTITTGVDASRSVTFAQASGAGSVTGLGAATASGGVATKVVTGSLAGTVSQQATATLSVGSTSSNLLTFDVTFGTAAKLAFTQQPGASTGGVAFGTQPKVAVQDAAGNTVTTNTSSVSLALTTPGGATLSCTTNPLAAVAGVATFSGCKVDLAGSYTLTGTDGSLTSATSSSFTISVGTAAKLAFTQQPGASTGGVAFGTQPKVAVQDLGGNTVTTNTSSVTLALTTPGGATLSCTTNPLAAVAGVATFAGCKVDLAASYTLTATDGSLTSAASSSFAITVGAAAKLAFTQQPGASTGGVAFGTQPKVAVQDLGGNTVTTNTSSVTLALTTPGGATLTCTTNPLAAVAGVATFAGCKVDLAASYTLTATDGSLTSAASSSFAITVGAAAKLAFTQQPVGAATNVALVTQPVVAVQDLGGNTVTTDTTSVTLALTTPGGATLSCTTNPLGAVAGVATFAGCEVDVAAGYTLTATDGSLTSATSSSFTISAPNTMTARATGNWNAKATWQGVTKTGTITTLTTSATVTGSGTSFTSQLAVGDAVYKLDGTTLIGTVLTISSNTSLTLNANAAVAQSALGYAANGALPTSSDAVVVQGAFTVTIPASYAAVANSLTIGSVANATAQTVTFSASTSSLTTNADVTMNAPNGAATRNLTVNAGTLTVGGSLFLSAGASGTTSTRVNTVTITTGTVTVSGDLVFNTGNLASVNALQNQLVMSGGAGMFNLAGAFTINSGGGTAAGTLTPGTTSTFNFNGSAAQTVPIGVSSVVYSSLSLNNTSASGATLSAAVTSTRVTGNVTVGSGTFANGGFAIALATSKTFTVANGAVFSLTGTTGMVTGTTITKTFGATSTVSYAGAAQTVSNETYGNLSLAGSGTKTFPGSGPTIAGSFSISGTAAATAAVGLTVAGNFSIGSGSTFSASTFTHTVTGSFSNSGTFNANTSTFILNGAGTTIGGASSTFNNLTIGSSVSLSGVDATVGGTAALGANVLTTGANTLIVTGSVTRTTGFVAGNLRKSIATGGSTTVFEVGSGSTYAPVSLAITSTTVAGTITASTTGPAQHPSYATSGLSATKYVNRYWTLTAAGGLTVTGYNATFTFAATDLVGTPNTAVLRVKKFATGAWSSPTSSSSTSATATGTGLGTTFGDYASGE